MNSLATRDVCLGHCHVADANSFPEQQVELILQYTNVKWPVHNGYKTKQGRFTLLRKATPSHYFLTRFR